MRRSSLGIIGLLLAASAAIAYSLFKRKTPSDDLFYEAGLVEPVPKPWVDLTPAPWEQERKNGDIPFDPSNLLVVQEDRSGLFITQEDKSDLFVVQKPVKLEELIVVNGGHVPPPVTPGELIQLNSGAGSGSPPPVIHDLAYYQNLNKPGMVDVIREAAAARKSKIAEAAAKYVDPLVSPAPLLVVGDEDHVHAYKERY